MLNRNSTGAERIRGCFFSERFRSASDIALNQGTITGTISYRNNGAYFDGALDTVKYINYPANTAAFAAATYFSIVIEFTPNFAPGDNVTKILCASTTNNLYMIDKLNTASNNVLRIKLGDTEIASLSLAVYSPYWKTNQRNVLVVAGTSGDTSAWLNGNNILNAEKTAWTPSVGVVNFTIGDRIGDDTKFAGTFHSLKIFGSKVSALTTQEALDYCTNSNFNYMKRATCILPMTAECHDATGLKTLDVSGNGNHFTFGDGATSTTYPTKLAARGYSFDGGDSLRHTTAIGTAGDFSVSIVLNLTKLAAGSIGLLWQLKGTSSGIMGIYVGNTDTIQFASGVNSRDTTIPSTSGNVIILASAYNSTTSIMSSYCSGKLWNTSVATANDDGHIAGAYLGQLNDETLGLTGKIHYFALFPFQLTPLQVADLNLKLQKQVNMI